MIQNASQRANMSKTFIMPKKKKIESTQFTDRNGNEGTQ